MSGTATILRIVDENGRPAGGASLAVARSSVPFPEIALIADDDGRIELRLPDGDFTFEARDAAGRSGTVTVAGARGGEVVVRLARP
ncbi:MAG TPA: hypothetical protein VFL83_14150 [Anaeromyxobacter sp.]|nr:hypothetical protein [Anaeromyxobacter sp.]